MVSSSCLEGRSLVEIESRSELLGFSLAPGGFGTAFCLQCLLRLVPQPRHQGALRVRQLGIQLNEWRLVPLQKGKRLLHGHVTSNVVIRVFCRIGYKMQVP